MRIFKTYKKSSVLAALLFILAVCAVDTAEDATQPLEQKQVLSGMEQKMRRKISVDFRDTPIDDVIRAIAKQADLDMVKGPDVTGNVTATLTEVPLEEALNHILAAYGYTYVTSANMMRIVPLSKVAEAAEKLVTRVYRITYADVGEVEQALNKIVSKQRGLVSSNSGTSNIMVTATESRIKAIDTFIEEIDRRTTQILVEARIYDISSSDALDIGVQWVLGRRTVFDEDTGMAIGGKTEPFIRGEFDSAIISTPKTESAIRFGILDEHVDIDATFSARKEDICATLLANPRILVLDNETANIKIVSEVPYQELTQTAMGGNIGTTQFKEVGVELEVTPHVARDGMVRLKLRPKFSVQVDTVSIIIPTEQVTITSPQPVVDTREATTTALIRDGETVVIGGLRKKETRQEVSKVPVIGDMPVIGGLFRFRGEEVVNSELVVFITPWLIDEPQLTQTETHYLEATEISGPRCAPTKIEKMK